VQQGAATAVAAAGLAAQQLSVQVAGAGIGTGVTAATVGPQQAEQSTAHSEQPSHPSAQAAQGVAQQVGPRVAAW
jgi:hypothetical protein